jgi:hypothetical protein
MVHNCLFSYVFPHNLTYVDGLANLCSVYILTLFDIISTDLVNIFINLFWNEVVCVASYLVVYCITLSNSVKLLGLFLFWIYAMDTNQRCEFEAQTALLLAPILLCIAWGNENTMLSTFLVRQRIKNEIQIRWSIEKTPKTYIENAEWKMTLWMNKISQDHSSKCWTSVRNWFSSFRE